MQKETAIEVSTGYFVIIGGVSIEMRMSLLPPGYAYAVQDAL